MQSLAFNYQMFANAMFILQLRDLLFLVINVITGFMISH